MATHVLFIDLHRCLGSGSCVSSCRGVGNDPPKIGLRKLGPVKIDGKPFIEFLHYPIGACSECSYCTEIFQRRGTTPCANNCPDKAINIVKLEDLHDLLKERGSGEGFYIQVFK